MPSQLPVDSVGLVSPRTFVHPDDFTLQCDRVLHGFELRYETYGQLNTQRTNAVLICHALSGDHHAAGYHSMDDAKPGWWDVCIGPGKAVDTNRFYVVSCNNLGGCSGSTGPRTMNPETGQLFGPLFPTVTVTDWVLSQALLADHLGIDKFAAIVGGSLGGMQAMQWSISYPERLHAAVLIASASRLSAQNIAFNEVARHAITSDPEYREGYYAFENTNPDRGLGLARMVGHITYLSPDGMGQRFGREIKSGDIASATNVEFQVESYLHHQGQAFSKHFDANTYLLMTRALDYFDPARDFEDSLDRALAQALCKFLVISFSSDWRFSTHRSTEITDALVRARKNVASAIIQSDHGHDSFLLPIERYTEAFKIWMNRVADETASFGGADEEQTHAC